MGARVLVVGLHDVAEQQARPAIGGGELERVVDPRTPLLGEDAEEREQGQGDNERPRHRDGRERHQEPTGAKAASTARTLFQ